MTTTLIAVLTLVATFLSGNAQRVAAIVTFGIAAHYGLDSQLVEYGYFVRFGIAATFDAMTICAILKLCDLDRCATNAIRLLSVIMLVNILTGLSDSMGFDIYEAYYQVALTLYALLIVSIGALSNDRANPLSELGGVFNRLRSLRS